MENGFNMIDFLDLPGFERCVIRLILRESEVTYPQLVEALATLPEDQQMDQYQLDTTLTSLSDGNWLVSEGEGDQRRYRVSVLRRSGNPRNTMLDELELESIDRQPVYRVDLESATQMLTVRSGGKRALPTHVWDCLTDPAPEERSDASAKRRTGRLSTGDSHPPKALK